MRPLFPIAIVVASAFAGTPALAQSITVSSPGDQSVIAGQTLSFNVTSNVNATWSIIRNPSIQTRGCGGLPPIGFLAPVIGATISSGPSTSATVTYDGAYTAYGIGTQTCVKVTACVGTTCSSSAFFNIVVSKSSAEHATARAHNTVVDIGSTKGTKIAVYPRQSSVLSGVLPSTVMELASCPPGAAECAPPSLPSWITGANITDRYGVIAKPPFGTVPGLWTFRVKPPSITSEREPNDSTTNADPITNGVNVTGSVSHNILFGFGDTDVFFVEGVSGQTLTAEEVAPCPSLATTVAIVDRNGNTLNTRSAAAGVCASVSLIMTSNAQHFISVSTSGNGNTDYVLRARGPAGQPPPGSRTVDLHLIGPDNVRTDRRYNAAGSTDPFPAEAEDEPRNDVFAEGAVSQFGPVRGDLDPAGDTDTFQFYADPRFPSTFAIVGDHGGPCPSSSMRLVIKENTNGGLVTLADSDDHPGACAAIHEFVAPHEGSYYVTVSDDANEQAPGYMLEDLGDGGTEHEPNGTTGTASFIGEPEGVMAIGSLSSSSDVDFWFLQNKILPGDVIAARATGVDEVCPGAMTLSLLYDNTSGSCSAVGAGVVVIDTVTGDGTTCPAFDLEVAPCAGTYYLEASNGPVDEYRIIGRIFPASPPLPDVTGDFGEFDTQTFTYGTCGAGQSLAYSGNTGTFHNVSHVALYDESGESTTPACSASTTAAFDGAGICRFFADEPVDDGTLGISFVYDRRGSSSILYAPDLSQFGPVGAPLFKKFHVVGYASGADPTRNADSKYLKSVGNFFLFADTTLHYSNARGGNDLEYQMRHECNTYCGLPGCATFSDPSDCGGKAACVVDAPYDEGAHIRFDLSRYNRTASVTLARCTGFSDSACTQPLLGASYDSATDELRWDVPSTAGTAQQFFRLRAQASGDPTNDFYFVVNTRDVPAFGLTGSDLYPASLREDHPEGFQTEDARFVEVAGAFGFSHNTPASRSLLPNDIVIARVLGLNGLFAPPRTFHVDVSNRGNQASAATFLDVFVVDPFFDTNGNLSYPIPQDAVPYTSVAVPAMAVGASQNVSFTLAENDMFTQDALTLRPRALHVQVRGNTTEPVNASANNVLGPVIFSEVVGTIRKLGNDVHGEIVSVTPASPHEGDAVSVYTVVESKPCPASPPEVLRFYNDQPSPPTGSTAFDEQLTLPGLGDGGCTAGFTHVFTAHKPANATDTLSLRAFADATNTVAEDNETNNIMPSTANAFPLPVQNTPPSFLTNPPTAATEDITYSYDVQVNDDDAVDRARMTLTLQSGPAGMVLNTPVLFGNGKRATLSWAPTDAQAAAGTQSVTLRTCDGDPVVGGAGACVDQSFVINVTRVNDPPIITSTPPNPVLATEDALTSYTMTAVDEESGTVTFSISTPPPQNGGSNPMTVTTLSPTSARFDWTPGDDGVGSKSAQLRVSDGVNAVTQVVNFNVANVNDTPVVGPASSSVGTEDQPFSATLSINDADVDVSAIAQTFVCSLVGAPSWVSVATTNTTPRHCTLSGTPLNADTGLNSFTVRVTDNGSPPLHGDRAVSIDVANVNDAPSLGAPSATSATQGQPFTATLAVSDADLSAPGAGESFTFFKDQGPAAMVLTPGAASVTLTWTPGPADVNPPTVPVTIRVRDSGGLESSRSFTVSVTNVNDPPVLQDPPDATITEGQSFNVTLVATDADIAAGLSDTLTFSIVSGAPPGMSINSATGAVALGTTDDAQVGTFNVKVRVRDAANTGTDQTFVLTVTNVEEPPVLAPLGDESTDEDAPYTRTISATDPDPGSSVTYSLTSPPAGMTIGSSSGVINFTPANADVGDHTITVVAKDNTNRTATQSYTLTVINVNDAPVITSTPITTGTQDQPYSYAFTANDVDAGDVLTLSAITLPSWLLFNTNTGVLAGTPRNADAFAANNVTLRVSDGTVAVTQSFSITVANVNDPPVLAPIGNKAVNENANLSFSVGATDPDPGTTLTLSVTGLPTGAAFNAATGAFSWTPSSADIGNHSVTFTASDGALTDQETINIAVGNVNDPPVLDAVGDKSVNEGVTLSFTVTASDPDGTTPTLNAVGEPGADPFLAGATFNAATGAFSWATDFTDSGTYFVTFSASDSEFTDTEIVQITVAEVNRPPVITSTAPTTTNEDAVFTYAAAGNDPDGDSISWSLTTRPAGMVINASSGAVTWDRPLQADVGPHAVTIHLSDGRGGSADQSFTLTVQNVNDAPVFTSSPPTSGTEDVAFSYTATATDEDPGTTLVFSAPTLPAWLSFNASTHVLSGTPREGDSGNNAVTLRVSDGTVNVDQSFVIAVAAVNDPPAFVAPTPSGTVNGAEGSLLTFTLAATDPDSANLSFSMTGLPTGATLNAASGAFSWTPSFTDAGTRNVTLVVSDGALQDTRPLAIVIADTDRPPVISAPATASGAEGTLISFSVSGSDPDGDAVTLSLVSGPTGATFNAATGAFSFTPDFNQSGTQTATFRATAGGLTADATTTITVSDVNRPPVVTSTAPTSANEDALLTYTVTASDPDGDTPLSFALTVGPSNATLGPTTPASPTAALLSWTPVQAQVGSKQFEIRVSDGHGGVVNHDFTIVVANVNDPPVFTSVAPTAATQDVPYNYTPTTSDEDGDTLSFSLTTAPATMTVNAASGALTYLPRNADVGSHNVALKVDDGHGGTATQSFTVVVANVNDAPVFAANPAPATAVLQDDTFTFKPSVTDPDTGDTVTLSLVSPPSGMTLVNGAGNASGPKDTVTWTPGNDDVGDHPVRVRATNPHGATTDLAFTLTVVNVNDTPFFATAPIDAAVTEGALFSATVVADDIDLGDSLVYTLIGNPPRAAIDPDTGALTFLPDDPDTGPASPVTFTVRVEDLAGAFVEQTARFTVTAVNDPPVLAPIADVQVQPGDTVTITLSATDPDGPVQTFIATASDGGPLPAGATLTGNVFTWPTDAGDLGVTELTFKVSDSITVDTQNVTIIVGDGGLPPVLTLPPDASVDEGQLLQATVSDTDPNGDPPPPVTAQNLPPGATFDGSAFAWTPGFDQAGSYTITFVATNGSGATRRDWLVTVRDKNRPPVVDAPPELAALEASPYQSQIGAHDPDGDVLTFTLATGPTGLAVSSSGLVTWTPAFADVGIHALTVRIADGKGAVIQPNFSIVVAAIDVDDDGLPDTYEVQVGLDPTRNDAGEDPDQDGLSNLEEFIENKDPFVSNAPGAPVLLAPADGARSDVARPTFTWSPSTDPDGDAVSYELRVAPVDDPSSFVINASVPDAAGEVSFTAATDLAENTRYTWRVRATDGVGFSTAVSRTVLIDTVNEPAPAPTLISPPDGASVATQTPTLRINPVVDPDDEPVSYIFRLRTGPSDPPTFESQPVAAPPTGTVSLVVPDLLPDGSRWFWEAQSRDARGLLGGIGGPSTFTVDVTNLPPSDPVVISPADGETVSTPNLTLSFVESIDPEGAAVVDTVQVARDAGFDPAGRLDFGPLSAVGGVVSVDLQDLSDGVVFWRASASDGVVASDVVEGSFTVDATDDPPAAPSLIAPSNNALVESHDVLTVVELTADPEGGPVAAHIEILDTADTLITSVDDVADEDDGVVDGQARATFTLDDGLYHWRARVDEPDGVVSAFSEVHTFRVQAGNARPAAPVLIAPAEGEVVTTATPTLRFAEAVDPDGDAVTHDVTVHVDGALAFSQAGLRAEGGVVELTVPSPLPAGAATWTVRGRDLGGAGNPAVGTFVIDLGGGDDAGVPDSDGGPVVDGGPGADAGTDEGVDGGTTKPGDDIPVTGDFGPAPLPPASCGGCSGTGPVDAGFFGAALVLLGAALRRRRR